MNHIDTISKLVQDIDDTAELLRMQNYPKGNIQVKLLVADIENISAINSAEKIMNDDEFVAMNEYCRLVVEAYQNLDYVLVADILSSQLFSLFSDILGRMITAECEKSGLSYLRTDCFEKNLNLLEDKSLAEKIRKDAAKLTEHPEASPFHVEATNIGTNTLKFDKGTQSYYYHSNINPIKEGIAFAKHYTSDECYSYMIFGFGMGYHAEGFLLTDRRLKVTVLEFNLDVLTLAFMHRDLTATLSDENFSLIYDNADAVTKIMQNNKIDGLLIHHPSLMSLPDGNLKTALNDFFFKQNASLSNLPLLDCNFFYNIQRNDKHADEILPKFNGRDVIFIGGGPSLNDNFSYLKKIYDSRKKIIATASTSYRLLLEHGIVPDFVFIIDAHDTLLQHIDGIADTGASLVYLCTASRKGVDTFAGEHYIMLQSGYRPAEKEAHKNNLILIETGNSVATAAIDFILRSDCTELMTMGLDMAFTDNMQHAFDTKEDIANRKFIEVEGVDGKPVKTTRMFNLFRTWIEARLKQIDKDIPLINVSRGAKIAGMKNVTSTEALIE